MVIEKKDFKIGKIYTYKLKPKEFKESQLILVAISYSGRKLCFIDKLSGNTEVKTIKDSLDQLEEYHGK